MTETLRCKCGGEVRIVRLNARTLALGHAQNPRNHRHPVTLARDGADREPLPPSGFREDSRRHRRVREDAPARMPNRTRPAANGPTRTSPALGAPSSGS